jgi:short-subunit dehydrogenase
MELINKRILITGAARGLGHELAVLLEKDGSSLVLVDRDPISSRPGVQTYQCDLSDLSERKQLINVFEHQKIDVLINCAGIGSHSALSQMNVDEIESVMQVNALAPLELIAGLGSLDLVVNIGSVAGEMTLPSIGLYSASKAAVHAFTRSVQMEGVRTLLVILGPLRGTDFVHSIAHPRTGQPAWYRALDLDVNAAAGAIIQAIKKGKHQIILPRWYGILFPITRLAIGFSGYIKSFLFRH